MDTKFNQLMENVDAAADRGIVLPRIFLDYSISRHRDIAGASTTSSPFYTRFQSDINQIDGLTASERDNLLQDARSIISAEIAPAYQRLINQLEGQLCGTSQQALDRLRIINAG